MTVLSVTMTITHPCKFFLSSPSHPVSVLLHYLLIFSVNFSDLMLLSTSNILNIEREAQLPQRTQHNVWYAFCFSLANCRFQSPHFCSMLPFNELLWIVSQIFHCHVLEFWGYFSVADCLCLSFFLFSQSWILMSHHTP